MSNIPHQPALAEIVPEHVYIRLTQGEPVCVLDVRQPDEYQQAHVQGSVLIPLDQLALHLGELPNDRPIVALCRSGNRSSVATGILTRAGFNAVNLKGGITQWEKQGLPLERG